MEDLNRVVAQIIKKKRLERGLSKAELSRRIGIPSAYLVCKWENAICIPGASYLIRLADFFECSIDELVGRKWRGK